MVFPLLVGILSLGASTHSHVDALIIAPHPDDEILMAAGAMKRAIDLHLRVAVVLVTNGDLGCDRNGYLRQRESVAALKELGIRETDIYSLGYPDGALVDLNTEPLPPRLQRNAAGACAPHAGTYADTTSERLDFHSARTGTSASWTAENLVADLSMLLDTLDPSEVYLPHSIDEHPDHRMTYVYFRRAIDRLDAVPNVVHRSIVHAGRCWPSDCQTFASFELGMPPLPVPLDRYVPTERRSIDAKLKFKLIQHHKSQLDDWIRSFARRDEIFFSESYVKDGKRWVRRGSRAVNASTRIFDEGHYVEVSTWDALGFSGLEVNERSSP